MTQTDDPAPVGRAVALARLRELAGFYDALRSTFLTQLQHLAEGAVPPSKTQIAKLVEMQATHVHLLKAEDSFIEKFGQGADDADIDHEAMRRDIGRALDRIRATAGAGAVSGGTDGGAGADPAASVPVLGDAPPTAARG